MTAILANPRVTASEPLARATDIEEYRDALARYRSGEWDDERWTAFRLRYGVYGQRQSGVQMVRIKIPGGILPTGWARTAAAATRRYARGDIHLTTRQDLQIYFVALDATPGLLAELHAGGLTTREACGNTLRNMSSCALSGICPRERVDAGVVAERLSRSWIRHPLVQHMPRKFKVSVSGCETDCGAASIHDLGIVATEKDGRAGFRLYAGGGLGGPPRPAIVIEAFVTEAQLPAALAARLRIHQRYSNRVNRNAARIKFVVKRLGEEKFLALYREERARADTLPQRAFEPFDWRQPTEAPEPRSPGGVVRQSDGRMSIVVNPLLGLLTPDQLDALADIAEGYASGELRTTREQNIAILGVEADLAQEVVDLVRALGLPVEEHPGDVPDVVSCPGTTTCRIGITNSQTFGNELQDLTRNYQTRPEVTIRISGCQNGCGLHHVGDFGFRGMAKKIGGRNAPHYQIYIGGNEREAGAIGLAGPIVPARHAREALGLLMDGYSRERADGESVRGWALRMGKAGLVALLGDLDEKIRADDGSLFVDWGDADTFAPPTVTRAECAASYAIDILYRDLADDGLVDLDRAIFAGDRGVARDAGKRAVAFAARRLLMRRGIETADDNDTDDLIARAAAAWSADDRLAEKALAGEQCADDNFSGWREDIARLLETVEEIVSAPEEADVDLSQLGDFDPSVLALMGGQPAAE